MRYLIISFPYYLGTPITTDFRLIAFSIAFFRKLIYSEIYVIDNDIGEFIFSYRKQRQRQQKSAFSTIRGIAGLVFKIVRV